MADLNGVAVTEVIGEGIGVGRAVGQEGRGSGDGEGVALLEVDSAGVPVELEQRHGRARHQVARLRILGGVDVGQPEFGDLDRGVDGRRSRSGQSWKDKPEHHDEGNDEDAGLTHELRTLPSPTGRSG